MIKLMMMLVFVLAPNMVLAADGLELNEYKAADVIAEMESVPMVVPALPVLKDATKQPPPSMKIFCMRRDVTLWGTVTYQGANLGFRIWEPEYENGGYLSRVSSDTKFFKYIGGDRSGQIQLTLYIPPNAFLLPKNVKFTSILYALGDGNDIADKYNLACVIK